MQNQTQLFDLLAQGKIKGFSSIPKLVETVISRVFIFEQEKQILKFYKRDNEWWNKGMRDLSQGESRTNFIRQDFAFNQFLNPKIYAALKTAAVRDGLVELVEPQEADDELVIVMNPENVSATLTEVLFNQSCSLEECTNIGRTYAQKLKSLPREFMSAFETNWHEQFEARLIDMERWIASVGDWPQDLAKDGVTQLRRKLDEYKKYFQTLGRSALSVSIDCNSENLIYSDGELRFLDAYPPKDEWRIGDFIMDIFRTGSDVYALAGKDAYEAYLKGVMEIAGERIDRSFESFYLLYGALIMSPYLFALSKKNPQYLPKAEKYLVFVKELITIGSN